MGGAGGFGGKRERKGGGEVRSEGCIEREGQSAPGMGTTDGGRESEREREGEGVRKRKRGIKARGVRNERGRERQSK